MDNLQEEACKIRHPTVLCQCVLQRVAVCCSVCQCVPVCCSVLQCVAAWCTVAQFVAAKDTLQKEACKIWHPTVLR